MTWNKVCCTTPEESHEYVFSLTVMAPGLKQDQICNLIPDLWPQVCNFKTFYSWWTQGSVTALHVYSLKLDSPCNKVFCLPDSLSAAEIHFQTPELEDILEFFSVGNLLPSFWAGHVPPWLSVNPLSSDWSCLSCGNSLVD